MGDDLNMGPAPKRAGLILLEEPHAARYCFRPQEWLPMPTEAKPVKSKRLWLTLLCLLAVSAVMYASIMYKIVNYGP